MNVLLIFAIWMTASAASAPPPQSTVLAVGSPVDRSIAAGDSHTFDLRLEAEQAAVIEIEEDEIDVTLKVTDPSGDTIAQVTDLFGGQGRRQMIVAAETAGPFVVTVSARRWPIASGSYTLRLTGLRQLAASDREQLRAMRLRAEEGRAEDAGNLELATARAAEAAVAERPLPTAIWRSSPSTSALTSTGAGRVKAQPLRKHLSLLERSVGPDHPRWPRAGRSRHPDRGWNRAGRAMIRRRSRSGKRRSSEIRVGLTLRDLGLLLERVATCEGRGNGSRALAIQKAGATHSLAGDVLNNLGLITSPARLPARG